MRLQKALIDAHITHDTLLELREQALNHGDEALAAICSEALDGWKLTDREAARVINEVIGMEQE